MIILSIETSCDETAVSIVEATGELESPSFTVLGNALFSQIEVHKKYGGVYPMLAKREHARNLIPLLTIVLKESNLISKSQITNYKKPNNQKFKEIEKILEREEGLFEPFKEYLENLDRPDIDLIAVTSGPGLEPALWVGISFAKALGELWGISVTGVNHMEGHIASVLLETDEVKSQKSKVKIQFPALALLISGGHTELVLSEGWGKYRILGQTRDDAVGEAFDKAARMLDLPYPGGPEISRLAESARKNNIPHKAKLPRPMFHSNDLNFSFSGLKTAVLYYIRDHSPLSSEGKADLAREFEDSVIDVLVKKTKDAIMETGAKTLIVAGGVIANKRIREAFTDLESSYQGLIVKIPTKSLATDNALMIAFATYINVILGQNLRALDENIIANGNLRLEK